MTEPMTRPEPPVEPALEPELPICDPHHHLWDREGSRYLLDELLDDLGLAGLGAKGEHDAGSAAQPSPSRHNVVSTVFVECMSEYRTDGPPALRPLGETEFVERVAREAEGRAVGTPRVAAGIVGFADLTLGAAVDAVLEAHLGASPRFRGIRHAAGWHPSAEIRNSHTNPTPGLLGDARFREGFARLAAHGLSFDAWQYHPQLGELADLARAFPATTIVLDHVGGPLGIGPYEGRRDEAFRDWRRGIEDVAGCPNVVVKLGGLAMPINGFDWHKRPEPPSSEELAAAQAPYHESCIELFGPDRAMFESNFPVDRVSCSYSVLWNAFKRIASGASAQEKAALFHDTAARVYRLSTPLAVRS